MSEKSLGERFIEGEAYKAHRRGEKATDRFEDVSVKTLMQTSAGYAPQSLRNERIEVTPLSRLFVVDLPMVTETVESEVKYMVETLFTNESAEVAEGGSYPETELELTEESSPIQKITVSLPCTDEVLEDVTRARDYVNNRLAFMLRQRLNGQIISGDGNTPILAGVLSIGAIQSQALGGDTILDALNKAITKVRHTGHAEPDAVILHPADWQAARLAKATGGAYLWGFPGEGGREQVWGVPVIVTAAIAEGTGLVGAFRDFSELAFRKGIEVEISIDHDEMFTAGTQMIRAHVRVGFVVYRPTAFCKVTGI